MADFNVFNPNTQFTHESSKKRNHLFTNTQFTHASSKKGIASLLILNSRMPPVKKVLPLY